jgi:hypothetical protein
VVVLAPEDGAAAAAAAASHLAAVVIVFGVVVVVIAAPAAADECSPSLGPGRSAPLRLGEAEMASSQFCRWGTVARYLRDPREVHTLILGRLYRHPGLSWFRKPPARRQSHNCSWSLGP